MKNVKRSDLALMLNLDQGFQTQIMLYGNNIIVFMISKPVILDQKLA